MSKNLNKLVDEEKIVAYLLNKNHKDGSSKASFLIAKGFNPEQLKDTLIKHFNENDVAGIMESDFGIKYVVEGIVKAPDDSKFNLRSVWIKRRNENFLIFVTAYPI